MPTGPSLDSTSPVCELKKIYCWVLFCFSIQSLLAYWTDCRWGKIGVFLYQAVKARRVVRSRGSQIFSTPMAHRWQWGQPHAPAAILTPRKIPGTHFSYSLSGLQGHSAAGRIRSIEKSNDLIGIRTRHLPACNIVPQPTTIQRAPIAVKSSNYISKNKVRGVL
jgi:hypothetical protein